MKINKEWHLKNRMPENAGMDERIAWHLEHHKFCSCREIPASILAELKKRRIKIGNPK